MPSGQTILVYTVCPINAEWILKSMVESCHVPDCYFKPCTI